MKKIALILLLFFLVFIIFLIVKKLIVNNGTEKVQWNSPNESITLDYIVGKSGHLYLKGQMNGITGLFLFDTGAEISLINEKYITGKELKIKPFTINDAKGIKQTKNVYLVKSFELDAIKINELDVFPADSLMWKSPKGIFYNQDSIVGVVGNNIISKFIWDFDMVKKRVTVSNSKSYCNSIPDSLAIVLVSRENHKEIQVQINGKLKRLTLDFGSYFPISLSGSIPNKKNSDKNNSNSQKTKSGLTHLYSKDGKESKFDFVNIKLGTYEFREIQCFENDGSALLGIPFVWSFKRVVIDFINNKAFFITLNEKAGDFGVIKFNRQSVFNAAEIIDYNCKPEGSLFIFEKDSIRIRYVGYGKLKVYKNNNKLDSIYCYDSLKFPDGKMKYGPFALKIKF
jgi:hypothetical protein